MTDLSTMTETTDTTFDPAAIRARLPSTLTDEQERALIAAVRNPDAPIRDLARATAVEPRRARHALDSVVCGVLGGEPQDGAWINEREGTRKAETFGELTDRQKAVVDYLARNPGFPWAERSSRELLAAIEAADEGAAADAPPMHYTYPKSQAAEYASLIDERRAYLVEHRGLDLDESAVEVDDSGLRPGGFDAPRDLLADAGYDLPDENLDSLDADGEALDEDERLGLAFKNANDLRDEDAGRQCGPCGAALGDLLVCPECPCPDVHGVPVEDHLGEVRDMFAEDDVEKGVAYVGVVNAVAAYGVFVTVGGDRKTPTDVSGLLPMRLAPDGVDLLDYEAGDPVRVVLHHTEDAKDADDDMALFFAWPAERHVEGHVGESDESDGVSATGGEPVVATDGGADATQGDESATLDDLAEWFEGRPDGAGEDLADLLAEHTERLAALERENERLRAQVDENGEALPTPEQAEKLNEAASTVLATEARLDAMSARLDTVAEQAETVESAQANTVSAALGRAEDAGDELADLRERVEGVEGRMNDLGEWFNAVVDGEPREDEPPATLGELIDELGDLREQVETVEGARTGHEPEDDLAEAAALVKERGGTVSFNIDY